MRYLHCTTLCLYGTAFSLETVREKASHVPVALFVTVCVAGVLTKLDIMDRGTNALPGLRTSAGVSLLVC
jgi:hypothetical protein